MLDSTKYQQMAGRAGRAGLDTQGEAIIMANPSTATLLSQLMQVSLAVPAQKVAALCSLTYLMRTACSCSVSCAAVYCTALQAGDDGP